jgi:16S rRNA (uracil1498-N3)-methyltransferase
MKVFYSSNINEDSDLIVLDEVESFHAIKVLRLQNGDEISLLNGKGYKFSGIIQKADLKGCTVNIISSNFQKKVLPDVSICMAVIKKRERVEWFVEKAVELGVNELVFFPSFHSEKEKLDLNRINKIVISALKQSGNCWIPNIELAKSFEKVVSREFNGQNLIAYCPSGNERFICTHYVIGQPARILIGPEGDFSPEEILLALRHDFREISLGPLILRAETAALTALTIVKALNQC